MAINWETLDDEEREFLLNGGTIVGAWPPFLNAMVLTEEEKVMYKGKVKEDIFTESADRADATSD